MKHIWEMSPPALDAHSLDLFTIFLWKEAQSQLDLTENVCKQKYLSLIFKIELCSGF